MFLSSEVIRVRVWHGAGAAVILTAFRAQEVMAQMKIPEPNAESFIKVGSKPYKGVATGFDALTWGAIIGCFICVCSTGWWLKQGDAAKTVGSFFAAICFGVAWSLAEVFLEA